jgi:hypothetical protein
MSTRLLALAIATLSASGCATARSNATAPRAGAPPEWSERIQVASGEAHRGPWVQNESNYRWVDDPGVDIQRHGEIAIAWVDQARKDIFFQRYGEDGKPRLLVGTNVSRTPETFSWLPRVVVAPENDKNVFVLWQEIVFSGGTHGGEIYFARSTDGGQSFSEPANLSNTKAGDGKGRLGEKTWDNGSLDLARGPGGELYATWTEYEGGLWLRRSTDAGQTFAEPLLVGGTQRTPARAPALAAAVDGTVHLAWAVGEDPAADIHFASSSDGGRSFSSGRKVCESSGHSDAPKIATDSKGTVHLVYAESEGQERQYAVRYSRLRYGGDFEKPRRLAGPNGKSVQSAHFPNVSVDAQDRVYVLWEEYPDARERPHALAFTYSTNGGDQFAEATAVPGIAGPGLGFNGSQQGMLASKLAVNDGGSIAIVNSTFQPDKASHVWLIRGRVLE